VIVLGIETSCDDSSVALVDADRNVLAQISVNQDQSHAPFGGVVPEVASRRHTENLLPLIDRVMNQANVNWDQVSAIAVTSRPGLIGSLLVGVVTAKTLALAKNKKLIDVNHIEGHLLAALLKDKEYQPRSGFDFPYLGLAVSGGHTHLFEVRAPGKYKLLGKTIDDAAGEAFDKFAKMLKLGFPGGVAVDKLAQQGNPEAYSFPRGLEHDRSLNFSFSGLKTAALRTIEKIPASELEAKKADLAASYQFAIVDILVKKLMAASEQTGLTNWTITGGVSANSSLRAHAQIAAQGLFATLALPPLRYCTDNAAMIALAGLLKLQSGREATQELSPSASSLATDWLDA
jgi:N6-L-threonylcarbamoyladenine synthase